MGYYLTAEEWQLLAFFEVEPTRFDPDIEWPYNDFTYRVAVQDFQITFDLNPANKNFTLTVLRGGEIVVQLSAMEIFDIRYHEDRGAEWLELLISQRERIELRLRPRFQITGSIRSLPH